MDKPKVVCKIIKNMMMKKDPHCFQEFNLCDCRDVQTFCIVKFKEIENYFPRNFKEFKKCVENNNGKLGGNS